MQYLIGFLIAVVITLTGVGAGTITTPALILFLHVPAPLAVATGLAFSAAVKLVLVPAQILRRQVDWRTLTLMLFGGVPGVLLGSLALRRLATPGSQHVLQASLGAVLILTALWQLAFHLRPARARTNRPGILPYLMLPVGAEVGFSSAGAGALGTAALLSLTTLTPTQVVGTDITFGFLTSLIGSAAHGFLPRGNSTLLIHLVLGGLAGVATGLLAAPYIPRRPLRLALWLWLLLIGAQLLYLQLHR